MEFPVYEIDADQHYVFDCLDEAQGNFFLTGKAGTGKSTLLQAFRRISDKKAIYLAPTGVAAIHIKGQTIHSFFKFPPGWIRASDYRPLNAKLLEHVDWIIIDEISMVRADLLDHIDQLLRRSLKSSVVFGGKPMLWIGDLFQLPPVITHLDERNMLASLYESPYFFSSKAFQSLKHFEMIELQKIHRQKDLHFIRLLNKIRENQLEPEDLEEINAQCLFQSDFKRSGDMRIQLCTTNRAAQIYNAQQLEALTSQSVIYPARIEGQVLSSQFPADEYLVLKEGAQVMFLRNDPQKKYANGMLGVVETLHPERAKVRIPETGDCIEVEPVAWEVLKYKLSEGPRPELQTEVTGIFKQLPLKLAWAVTIHKSQGKTFESVDIDFGSGAFDFGQVYVAFSRCKTLQGIQLKRPLKLSDVRTDERVLDFLNAHR